VLNDLSAASWLRAGWGAIWVKRTAIAKNAAVNDLMNTE
jgi:hypothetical protein